ncbi:MAG: LTA synthase family protein [Clostridia bacterium]|nr:LTA synthase family protein [Clostridia bacterium]
MKKASRRLEISLVFTLFLVLVFTVCITLLVLWYQPNDLQEVLQNFQKQPRLIWLNAVPIGMLVLAFTFLFGNVCKAAALVNVAAGILSIANRIKLEVRDEPVFPRDFALLKEVGSAIGEYSIRYPVCEIVTLVVTTLAFVILGHFICGRRLVQKAVPRLVLRLCGAGASIAVLAGLILGVYSSDTMYNSFQVVNRSRIPDVFNELGLPYCFCYQFTAYAVDRPEGFRKTEAEAWEETIVPGDGKDVHVIFIMNEAFSDITDYDVFQFDEADDPLANLHALQQDEHAVCGHIVVPGFAAGTANTEFDVVTGMQTNALSESPTSAFRTINRNLNSLFRIFNADGYTTAFCHPGKNWFYNRENVYRWMGAQKSTFIEQMENPEYKGTWVTDSYTEKQIEQEFEAAVADGQTLFDYTTTIQNHMSYTINKYGEGYEFPEVHTTVPVSDEVETLLRVYTEGVRDADAMLGTLTDYFSQQNEPVVLVFYGDHLPYLGDNKQGYAELGLDIAKDAEECDNPVCSYETPFVIWANDAAAEELDWQEAVTALDLPDNHILSASFLGAAVLELTGRGTESGWFAFLNELRRTTPVVQRDTYMYMDGTFHTADELDAETKEQIEKWRKWSYYKLEYKIMPND